MAILDYCCVLVDDEVEKVELEPWCQVLDHDAEQDQKEPLRRSTREYQ